MEVRTDLAVEVRESFAREAGEIPGVELKEESGQAVFASKVVIKNKEGARIMRKPVGTYITLEAPQLLWEDEGYHREVSEALGKYLEELLYRVWTNRHSGAPRVLVVGLGNAEVTADSLGPRVLGNLKVTRHLNSDKSAVSGIIPGVMAQTGMESLEIVAGIVKETAPDVVIAIDALAARNVHRLGTTIQLTDTGIQPGSGVGNHRGRLSQENLAVPVIAIGVPTVIGANTIVYDTLNSLEEPMTKEEENLIRSRLSPEFDTMFVTPKDIDATVKRLSYTISEGINLVLQA